MKHFRFRRGMTTWQIIALVAVILLVVMGCIIAGLAAILLPALGKARVSAKSIKSEVQIREVIQAANIRARSTPNEVEGEVFSIPTDALVAENYFPPGLLDSPFGPSPDGGTDYWILPDEVDATTVSDSSSFIVMYDRAMYAEHGSVAVGYLDGQAEMLEVAAFEQLIASPPNDGRDFDLPPRSQ